jgi:NAD+ synthetase
MYNSALLAKKGELLGVTHKTLLPTYDIFDDLRYFEPNTEFKCLELDGVKLGVTICEDIWYNENEVQYHTYAIDPAEEQKKAGARCIINISASPYTNSKHQNRVAMLRNHARRLKLPVFYSNQVGAHTDVIFDGDSLAVDADAELAATTKPFESSYADVDWDAASGEVNALSEKQDFYPESKQERQFHAIRCGLRDYMSKTGFADGVVLGLSGGVDSALVCALAVEALGSENVKAITMPSEFSSEGSIADSQKLADNLGIELFELPIRELYESYNRTLEPLFGDLPFGVAEENLQSRIRGGLLMAYANKFNRFLLATGNKSEFAVGYATLYGDMNGALAIIGDLYKTEVYALCRWLNESYYKKEVIPEAIIAKDPSAELRPGQKDSDSLPDYEMLDKILFKYIEQQKSKKEICEDGFEEKIVEQVIRLVDNNEFKRFQAAPILKLASKSFGSGRRWPIVQQWRSQ